MSTAGTDPAKWARRCASTSQAPVPTGFQAKVQDFKYQDLTQLWDG